MNIDSFVGIISLVFTALSLGMAIAVLIIENKSGR